MGGGGNEREKRPKARVREIERKRERGKRGEIRFVCSLGRERERREKITPLVKIDCTPYA